MEIGLTSILNLRGGPYTQFPNMGKLRLTYVSILYDGIRPKMFRSRGIVCGGGGGRASEQHVCKVILVISLSLSQAEQ